MSDHQGSAIAGQVLARTIEPLLAGHSPEVQGVALADLLAIYLAGHVVAGDPAATDELRQTILDLHIEVVRRLIPGSERDVVKRLKREGAG